MLRREQYKFGSCNQSFILDAIKEVTEGGWVGHTSMAVLLEQHYTSKNHLTLGHLELRVCFRDRTALCCGPHLVIFASGPAQHCVPWGGQPLHLELLYLQQPPRQLMLHLQLKLLLSAHIRHRTADAIPAVG